VADEQAERARDVQRVRVSRTEVDAVGGGRPTVGLRDVRDAGRGERSPEHARRERAGASAAATRAIMAAGS
jgi:hypothetical protein